MDEAAVRIESLDKWFGPLHAVRGIDLTVPRGETLGFLGLNGAGKTTTIRILLDLLRPTSGRAFILGHDCQKDGLRARERVGYLPGALGAYGDMRGETLLDFLARLGGRRPDPVARRRLADRLELPASDLARRVREYSGGMKRKLGILQAFESEPALLILDEPTEGLDPLMQEAFYGILAEARARGATIFMSSHVLSEVEKTCDRIALLRDGALALCDTVERVCRLAPRRVRVTFHADVPPPSSGSPPEGAAWTEVAPRLWSLSAHGPLGLFVSSLAGLPVADIEVREPRLEDVVTGYYREDPP